MSNGREVGFSPEAKVTYTVNSALLESRHIPLIRRRLCRPRTFEHGPTKNQQTKGVPRETKGVPRDRTNTRQTGAQPAHPGIYSFAG